MPTLSKNSAVSWRRIYLLPIGTTGGFCDDGGNMTRRQKRHQPPRIARGLVLPNRPNPKTRPSRGDRKEPQVFPPPFWEAPTTHCCVVAVSEETATAVEAQSTSGCLGTRHD